MHFDTFVKVWLFDNNELLIFFFFENGEQSPGSASTDAHNLIYCEVLECRVLQFKDDKECSQKITNRRNEKSDI